MQVGSLFIALGFKVDDAKLKSFKDGVSSLQKEMFKLSAVAAGAVYSINRFLNQGVQSSVALRNYSVQTGQATDELERFANVAERANTTLTLDQVISSFREVGTVLDEIRRKGNYPTGALWMGLGNLSDIRDPADLVKKIYADMPNIMRRLNGDRIAFSNELSTIGLSGFENMFFLSPDKFQEWWSKAIPTSEQREAMERIAVAYKNFSKEFDMFKIRMGAKIEPYWVAAIDKAIPALESLAENLTAVGSALHDAFSSLDGGAQTGIIAGIGILVAALNPLKTMVLAIVWGLNEMGKKIRGEENWIDKSMDSFAALATQIPGAESIPWVRDRLRKQGLSGSDFEGNSSHSLIRGIVGGMNTDPESYIAKYTEYLDKRLSNGSVTNNTNGNLTYAPVYNTTTNADPYQLMDAIGVYDQGALSRAMGSMGVRGSGLRVDGY